jgi:hypothetical protein
VELLRNIPPYFGTQRFVTMFTRSLPWSLSWVRLIQSIPPHAVSLWSILILFSHLCLGLPRGLFPFSLSSIFYMQATEFVFV